MAVYTEVTDDALAAFLADYEIGSMVAFRGIAKGVENSNFSLRTTSGDFILTLYAKRVDPADLPWFLGLMETGQARHRVPAAGARTRRRGAPAAVRPPRRDHHIPARRLATPGAAGALRACGRFACGAARAGRGYVPRRPNALGPDSWLPLLERSGARAEEVQPGLAAELKGALTGILAGWPRRLPVGHIHADLFPDNVFFLDGRLSGLIDFYFAATDVLAYDVAVCLNAWCFEPTFRSM